MYRCALRGLQAVSRRNSSAVLDACSRRIFANSPSLVRIVDNSSSLVLVHRNFFSDDVKSKTPHSPLSNLIAKDAGDKGKEFAAEEEEATKQREKAWKTMKLTLLMFGLTFTFIGSYLLVILGAPERDRDGNIIEDDLSNMNIVRQYFTRTYRELNNYFRLIQEPSRDKLLPDPVRYPYFQPKYTLVLEMNDVLVHPDWTYNTGWRFKKRPAIDFFLESLHGHYEIVVYTSEQGFTVFPLMEALDPNNLITYKLVRDATHFYGGYHVKSLDKLNRDLSKVIVIDWEAQNVQFHPDNLLKIRRWEGADDDMSLVELSMFLKTIVENDVDDVREVLRYYSKYDDPLAAFREKQKKLMELLEAQGAAKKDTESKPRPWVPSLFARRQF